VAPKPREDSDVSPEKPNPNPKATLKPADDAAAEKPKADDGTVEKEKAEAVTDATETAASPADERVCGRHRRSSAKRSTTFSSKRRGGVRTAAGEDGELAKRIPEIAREMDWTRESRSTCDIDRSKQGVERA
jgi:hypothetical protein